jgi:hypothetical protein
MITFRRLFRRSEAPAFDPPDLLDHPDLQRMSLRELADLPLPRLGARQEPSTAAGVGARLTGDAA